MEKDNTIVFIIDEIKQLTIDIADAFIKDPDLYIGGPVEEDGGLVWGKNYIRRFFQGDFDEFKVECFGFNRGVFNRLSNDRVFKPDFEEEEVMVLIGFSLLTDCLYPSLKLEKMVPRRVLEDVVKTNALYYFSGNWGEWDLVPAISNDFDMVADAIGMHSDIVTDIWVHNFSSPSAYSKALAVKAYMSDTTKFFLLVQLDRWIVRGDTIYFPPVDDMVVVTGYPNDLVDQIYHYIRLKLLVFFVAGKEDSKYRFDIRRLKSSLLLGHKSVLRNFPVDYRGSLNCIVSANHRLTIDYVPCREQPKLFDLAAFNVVTVKRIACDNSPSIKALTGYEVPEDWDDDDAFLTRIEPIRKYDYPKAGCTHVSLIQSGLVFCGKCKKPTCSRCLISRSDCKFWCTECVSMSRVPRLVPQKKLIGVFKYEPGRVLMLQLIDQFRCGLMMKIKSFKAKLIPYFPAFEIDMTLRQMTSMGLMRVVGKRYASGPNNKGEVWGNRLPIVSGVPIDHFFLVLTAFVKGVLRQGVQDGDPVSAVNYSDIYTDVIINVKKSMVIITPDPCLVFEITTIDVAFIVALFVADLVDSRREEMSADLAVGQKDCAQMSG